MSAAYMFQYVPEKNRGSDYKPTYADFLTTRETTLGMRLGSTFSRGRSDIPNSNGELIKTVRFIMSFTGPLCRKLQIYQPQFCFVEYMGKVSYYKLGLFSHSNNLMEVTFNELIYDLKAYHQNQGY